MFTKVLCERDVTGSIRVGSTLATIVAAACVSLACALPASAAGASGYRLEQRSGELLSVITLSSAGARYEMVQPPRRGGRVQKGRMTVLLATIIRYADTREILLEPAQKLFQEVPLAGALSGYEREAAALKLSLIHI